MYIKCKKKNQKKLGTGFVLYPWRMLKSEQMFLINKAILFLKVIRDDFFFL